MKKTSYVYAIAAMAALMCGCGSADTVETTGEATEGLHRPPKDAGSDATADSGSHDAGVDSGTPDTGSADTGSDVFDICPGQLLCLVPQPYCFAICANANDAGQCPYDASDCFPSDQ